MSVRFDPQPVVLERAQVRLEPLALNHAAQLLQILQQDVDLWQYIPHSPVHTPEEMHQLIQAAQQQSQAGVEVPFAITLRATGEAVGSTRYLDIRRPHRNLEIGWTWLARRYQRTGVNTECKYLLLRHAFEDLGAIRVQLKTDSRNEQSQRAIARLGAMREGVLRNHMVLWNGFIRDTVYFSVIDSEWPAVKANLESKLSKY
ncbi:MAG: GNAT family N-acetyltransferase [Abitibacteriaceae bacterium]|nr:GNAT family N-acetyltransferase [Abditibacteriaceae bacterium]MBV9863821.1 GNAT family N-acetyltransferase [Abditibacteriaceae bacterium]